MQFYFLANDVCYKIFIGLLKLGIYKIHLREVRYVMWDVKDYNKMCYTAHFPSLISHSKEKNKLIKLFVLYYINL